MKVGEGHVAPEFKSFIVAFVKRLDQRKEGRMSDQPLLPTNA